MIAFEQPELFEERLAELSARFVSLPADQVDAHIDEALGQLLQGLGMDRTSLAQLSANGERLEVTHTRHTERAPAHPLVDLAAMLPWYTEMIRRGEVLVFRRLPEDLPPEATQEREYTASIGLRSQLTVPLRVADRVIGAIGFASFREAFDWSPRLIRSLRLVGEVFANAIARKYAEQERTTLRELLAHTARITTMGEVVASLAHEINQPLFAIVGNARAAQHLLDRESPERSEIRAALDDVVEDANRASAIIRRVRAFLRRKPPEPVSLDLNDVAETVRNFLRPELTRRRVNLVLTLAPSLPRVRGDAVQLQQVLVNLLINGADAMQALQPARRHLELRTGLDTEGRLLLAVVDTGPGIEPDARARLFEPFFTTKPNGLGMGLAICRSIVEAHGGRIEVMPSDGPGTTVRVTLPAELR